MSYSNNEIPDNLITLLTAATNFEVWFFNPELRTKAFPFKSEYVDFQANQVNREIDDKSKKELISEFLKDVEKGGSIARCWIPHHGVRATHNDELVEIAACFMCSSFRGEISGRRFYGAFPDEENSQSKVIFDAIMKSSSTYES